jgi:DNA-binding PadR family transcriptional regulator
VVLGRTERLFLNLLMGLQKKSSAYEVWSILRERGTTMAYKNVYTRLKRLEKLNLIEKVGKSKYGAINYRLTTQGLLYQISRFVNIDDTISWSDFLDHYSDSIIFKTLVLPYFEIDTIRHATVKLYFAITSYLHDCYQITLNAADHIKKAREEHNEEDQKYYVKRLKVDLEWQPRAFAFILITKSPDKVIVRQLAKDNKFVLLLNGVQRDFNEAYSVMNSGRSGL